MLCLKISTLENKIDLFHLVSNMNHIYKALVIRKTIDKSFTRAIENCNTDELPKGEVLIRVHYSSLNYKDGLSCIGNRAVTRRYPHTPGIDAAGIVESCSTSKFNVGDSVVIVSYDLGMNTAGGFGQYIRVPEEWVMPLPSGLSLKESMIFGTAGYTSGFSVYKLLHQGIKPEDGPIVVTGASGGVGSISVAILSKLGFAVYGSSWNPESYDFIKKLGASEVIGHEDVIDELGRPLLKETWAGVIDTLGGDTLSSLLKACNENGTVVAVGNVSAQSFQASILPFILRGINLLGVNSQGTSHSFRKELWSKLATDWKPTNLDSLATECKLDQLPHEIDQLLKGSQIGRVIVNMQ
jgi:acrylyl-CoA reductase (NADPH)